MSEGNGPLISLQGVSVAQSEHLVVTDVNLQVARGEFVYLIGKTGSGKSSLLRALYGDLPLSAGEGQVCGVDLKRVNRRNVHQLRRLLGIVFQDFALLPDRTVHANLAFVLRATGWNVASEVDQRIEACLKAVGLGSKGYKMPHQLSGGEQQRVAIARALLNSPALILADEPTGNLDPETTEEILALLHGLVRENRTVLMATHDHDALRRHPGRLIRCEAGRIDEAGADDPIVETGSKPAPGPDAVERSGQTDVVSADVPVSPVVPRPDAAPLSHAVWVAAPASEGPVEEPVTVGPPLEVKTATEATEAPEAAESPDGPDSDDARYEWDDQDDAWWESLPEPDEVGATEEATEAPTEAPTEPTWLGHAPAAGEPEQDPKSDDGPGEAMPKGIQFKLNR